MVLVDTSIWIRFLANRTPEANELDRLLSRNDVVGHEFVFGELLVGDARGRNHLLAAYAKMPTAQTVPHSDVVEFVEARRLRGQGVGWVDIHLLASAIAGRLRLWTADRSLLGLADALGVAYQPLKRI